MASDKVERMARVLEVVLSRKSTGIRLSEVCQELDSPLSSAHDLLRSMTQAGLICVDAERTYRIGPRFIQLAFATGQSLDVRVLAHTHLEQLAADLKHDVYLAIRVDNVVTYVDRIPGRGRAAVDIRLGDPVPLHSSAAGKLFCAYSEDLQRLVLKKDLRPFTSRTITSSPRLKVELAAIREQRYAISDEETITGIIGFAVPVTELSGPLTAAVHVSAFRDLVADTDIPAIVAEMQVCSDAIASAMGLHDEHEVHA
jgi:IclR family pca regulon transcriptional regulator